VAKLSASQLAGLVKTQIGGAGLDRSASILKNQDTDGPIFVAIALAESGGVTDKVSPPNADQWHSRDKGLWQINDHWHADLLKTYQWDKPSDNLAMAASLYYNRGGKFSDWSTWKTGAYGAFLPQAQVAWNSAEMDTSAADLDATTRQTSLTAPAEAAGSTLLGGVGDFLSLITKSSTWVRIGMGLAGTVLLLVVIAGMMKTKLPGPLGTAVRVGLKAKQAAASASAATAEVAA
jgi:hypothetical protein